MNDSYKYMSDLQAVNSANNNFKLPKPEKMIDQVKNDLVRDIGIPTGVDFLKDSIQPLAEKALSSLGIDKDVVKTFQKDGLSKAVNKQLMKTGKKVAKVVDNVSNTIDDAKSQVKGVKNTVQKAVQDRETQRTSSLPDFEDDPENVPTSSYFDDGINSLDDDTQPFTMDDIDDDDLDIQDAATNDILDPAGNVLKTGVEDASSDFRLSSTGRLFDVNQNIDPSYKVMADMMRTPQLDESAMNETASIRNSISHRLTDSSASESQAENTTSDASKAVNTASSDANAASDVSSDVNEAKSITSDVDKAGSITKDVESTGENIAKDALPELENLDEGSAALDEVPIVGELISGVLGLATIGASIGSLFKKKHTEAPVAQSSLGTQFGT